MYISDLYHDNERRNVELGDVDSGPPIMKSEVEFAVKKIKWRKTEGSDGVAVEMVEALGEFAIDKVTDMAKEIYGTGTLPQRMKKSEFIVIPMKVGAVDCTKHRTICIMSLVAKIIPKVIDERLKGKVRDYVDEEQYGFRKKIKEQEMPYSSSEQ